MMRENTFMMRENTFMMRGIRYDEGKFIMMRGNSL